MQVSSISLHELLEGVFYTRCARRDGKFPESESDRGVDDDDSHRAI